MIIAAGKANINKTIFIVLQISIILTIGLLSKDIWYSVAISIIGVIFNALVSFKVSLGFLVGFLYAALNGILAFYTKLYATFAFMIFMQAPMAIYSYFAWKKSKNNNDTQLKSTSLKNNCLLALAMFLLGIALYFILRLFQTGNIILDAIFFVFSVTACILLALRYKSAYIVTLLSGLGGTALWIYQMINNGSGLSIAAFYMIVSINSIIAIYTNYIKNHSRIIKTTTKITHSDSSTFDGNKI